MRLAFASEDHIFSMQSQHLQDQLPHQPLPQNELLWKRNPAKILNKNPVDVLLIDDGNQPGRGAPLEEALKGTNDRCLPKVIVVAGPVERILQERHLQWRKGRRKQLAQRGYQAVEWLCNSMDQGGALDQERVFDVYYQADHPWVQPPTQPVPDALPPRPMSNLLAPFGIPYKDRAPPAAVNLEQGPLPSETSGPLKVGTCGAGTIYHPTGCMVDSLDQQWIATEQGVRRIQVDELAKAKGLPSEWKQKHCQLSLKQQQLWAKTVAQATSLHSWVVVCDAIGEWCCPQHSLEEESWSVAPTEAMTVSDDEAMELSGLESDSDSEWEYDYPDLSPQGCWYRDRVRNLRATVEGRPDAHHLIEEGLEALEIHRRNYTDEGPKYLQLLWWEFPVEHQEAIRQGSSLCFLVDPGTELVPNPPLTEEQLEVVKRFVEELMSLGVLVPSDRPLKRVCPMFCVPKPGQPGQWRCIADMRRGGQNDCCGHDPIYLPSHQDILPHLYSGGWSGIADKSKYFHNFLTLPEERDLVGVIHPITGEHLWYRGLPMGSTNSPSISCRIGEGVMEMFRRECPLFHGTPVENTWRQALDGECFRPALGHGRVWIQSNGRPVAQIYGFVDDFMIHGATRSDARAALSAYMDLTVRLGFICQRVKTSPPAQVQKYCGMLYDTRKIPTLRVPPNKVSRCLASIDYLLSRPRGGSLSRLSLAVVTGVLQSIVDATPRHVGQAHLRALYDDMHLLDETGHLSGAAKYYTVVKLSPASQHGLQWWQGYLRSNPGASTASGMLNGLVLKWGDGSGTGTGGTTEVYPLSRGRLEVDGPAIELWMGIWRVNSRPNSSNWKELKTIQRALQHERAHPQRVRGSTVFYFTDNLVSYYVVNNGNSRAPKLHHLVLEIKELERELGCYLEVVHVPGTMMISQGADSQSRGIWLAPHRRFLTVNSLVFQPVPYSVHLHLWALDHLEVPRQLGHHIGATDSWIPRLLRGQVTLWTPPPEVARQAIVTFLQAWVQSPSDTSAVFLIPRILQRRWGRICRHILEIGVFQPQLLPAPANYSSLFPFVLLYVPPYVPVLGPSRLDLPPVPKPQNWHRKQAEEVRRLS